MTTTEPVDIETVEDFRERARKFIRENVPPAGGPQVAGNLSDEEELADVSRQRQLQRLLYDGGLAGVLVPREYGGQGLTLDHVRALNEEMAGRQYPFRLQVPGMTPCMTILLDFGTEEQKRQHVPAILRGDEIWMQMLSEPSGGSDVAGAQTTALRDGDEWVLNGSKVWTTGAWWSDWALCLTRTNVDVEKHRGLTVFMVPFDIEGLEMHRIEMLNGSKEFCQEFLTDVRIPDSYRIGEVDDGWTVGTRWMYYERSYASSPYAILPAGSSLEGDRGVGTMVSLAARSGRLRDPAARALIGEAHAESIALAHLSKRLPKAIMTRKMTEQAASIGKLMYALVRRRLMTIGWELAGPTAAVWGDDDADLGERGVNFLSRQVGEIAGGTTEMARNVVAERVLGMPRVKTFDKGVAFREIPKGPPARTREEHQS
jgi:alkylation response protein AidB-like acyl-CoA dehydrogenase